MNRLEWKSVLIGMLLALAIVFGAGAANQKKGEAAAKKSEEPAVGRFQIVIGGDARAVTGMILDTATGQVWFDHHVPSTSPAQPDKAFLAPKLKAEK